MRKEMKAAVGACVAAMALTATSANAAPIFQFDSTQTSQSSIASTFGYSFNVLTPQVLTALDLHGASSTGNAVRIYNAAGTIFSTKLLASDPTVTVGGNAFNERSISPLSLAVGLYYIVADVPASDPIVNFQAVNLKSTNSGITFGQSVSQAYTYGNPTGDAYDVSPSNSYVLVNFETAVAAAVPEPATWGIMILGMGAIGFAMRRRKNVRTIVSFA